MKLIRSNRRGNREPVSRRRFLASAGAVGLVGLTRKSIGSIPSLTLGFGHGSHGGAPPVNPALSDVSPFDYLGWFKAPLTLAYGASMISAGPIAGTLYVNSTPGSGSNTGGIGCINVPTTLDGTQVATLYSGVNGGAVNTGINAAVYAAVSEKTSNLVTQSAFLTPGGTLAVGYYWYYPGNRAQTLNYFTIDQNLDTSSIAVNMGIKGSHDAACYSYFAQMDSDAAAYLGYDMVSTQGVVSNDAVLSFGPSALLWNSANIGNPSIAVSDALFYPLSTPIDSFTNTIWNTPNTPPNIGSVPPSGSYPNKYWAEKTSVTAVMAPNGFSSLIFVYFQGLGFNGYGVPVTDTTKNGLGVLAVCTGNTSTSVNPNQITSVTITSNPTVEPIVGLYAFGNGIPSGATVTAYDSTNGIITLSANVTANNTGASFDLRSNKDLMVYNPTGGGKGSVSYPGGLVAVGYNLSDVANAMNNPGVRTSVLPSFVGQIPTPSFMTEGWIAGARGGYDPRTQRLYITLGYDSGGHPKIAVWQLRASTASALQCTDPVSLPGASLGSAYSHSMAIQGGTPPYTVIQQSLVNIAGQSTNGWLSLSSSGTLSGTPTVAETDTIAVTISDSASNSIQRSFIVRAQ